MDQEFITVVHTQFSHLNTVLSSLLRIHGLPYGKRVLGITSNIRATPQANLFVFHENFAALYSKLTHYCDLCIRATKSGAYKVQQQQQLERISSYLEEMETDTRLMEHLEFISKNELPPVEDAADQ